MCTASRALGRRRCRQSSSHHKYHICQGKSPPFRQLDPGARIERAAGLSGKADGEACCRVEEAVQTPVIGLDCELRLPFIPHQKRSSVSDAGYPAATNKTRRLGTALQLTRSHVARLVARSASCLPLPRPDAARKSKTREPLSRVLGTPHPPMGHALRLATRLRSKGELAAEMGSEGRVAHRHLHGTLAAI